MTHRISRGEARFRAIGALATLACLLGILSGCGGTPGSGQSNKNSEKSLTSLLISPANPVVPIGDSERFAVTGVFSDGSRQDVTSTVTWTATNPDIASVDKTGMALAKHAGNTVIEAVSGSVTGRVTLTVPPATLTSISLTPPTSSVPKGGTIQLSATALYADGTTADVTNSVTWASSASGVAGVNSTGLVTGAAMGTAMITATSGQIRGAETLTVLPPNMISLSMSPPSAVVANGRTQQIKVTGTFSDGTTQDVTGSVAWSVSPATVAAISQTGLVSTLAPGSATISAVSGSLSSSAVLTVAPPALTSLLVAPPNPSLTKGGTQQLTVTGSFSDASTQNMTGAVAWTVSPANVISVSNSGIITALANGIATVTATSGSVSGSDTFTVAGATLVSIAVTPANPTIFDGKTQQLTATGTYNDGSAQDITSKVAWTGAVPGVVNLSSGGLVTALGTGTATVTATSGSITGSDIITVPALALVSIAISPGNPSVPKGETQQLLASGTYNDGTTQDISSKVTWSGAVAGVVDLSGTGLISALGVGTATITATSGSISGTTAVTVSAAVALSLTVSPDNPSITVGSIQQFTAVEVLSDGTKRTVTNKATWTSANSDIASITSTGLASAVTEGTATLNASYGGVTGSGTLVVMPVTYFVTESSKRGVLSNSYFDKSNASGIDANVRVGQSGGGSDDICAMVYVFSADQEMSECCGCKITPNGLLTLSLNNDLTSNPLTGKALTRGTVEVVASDVTANPTCDPASLTAKGELTVWTTHIQAVTVGELPPVAASKSSASPNEAFLPPENLCQAIQDLGSGQGICTCGTGH